MKLFLVIVCLILFVSCEPRFGPDKPKNLISKAKMEEVLYDMFVINSAKGVDRKLFEKKKINPEYYILKKHNIDSTLFAQSIDYYAYDIKGYSTLLENINERITKEKNELDAIIKKEDAKKKTQLKI